MILMQNIITTIKVCYVIHFKLKMIWFDLYASLLIKVMLIYYAFKKRNICGLGKHILNKNCTLKY